MAQVGNRDLLIGTLALELNFARFDDIEGLHALLRERPGTSLAELLAEKGLVSSDRQALLERLADESLANQTSPTHALEALRLGRLQAERWASLNPSINGRANGQPSPDLAPSTSNPARPERFKIIRRCASGRLGVVSLALDTEFDREVAYKEIKEPYADDPLYRLMFLKEAEILSRLDHPGVPPIHAQGVDTQGRPFYAMKFVRGVPLADEIRVYHEPTDGEANPSRRSIQLRQLLGRLLSVCQTLAHAHQRGVVHGHLEPDVVNLGAHGETLVVGWGTQFGRDSSTPQPEPSDDIRALGSILYAILTGQTPNPNPNLESPQTLRRPRSVDPQICRSLEAICLSAMEPEPVNRYPSAQAMADDLVAWLAGEPISTRREGWVERSERWVKRHRKALTVAASLLLVGVLTLGSLTWMQSRTIWLLTRRNNQLQTASKATQEQLRLAESNMSQAIDTVRRVGETIAREPELNGNPRMDALRKRLLGEPINYYRKLLQRLREDDDPRRESLARLTEVGTDLAMLTYEFGDKMTALTLYREALDIQQRLISLFPSVIEFQSAAAVTCNSIGLIYTEINKPEEAVMYYRGALSTWRALAMTYPDVVSYQANLAACRNNVANLQTQLGRFDDALQSYRAALSIRRRLAEAFPNEPGWQLGVASTQSNIGVLLQETDRPNEALRALVEAEEIQRGFVTRHPEIPDNQNDLATTLASKSRTQSLLDRPEDALKSLRAALDIRLKLVQAHPSRTDFKIDLCSTYDKIGSLLQKLNQSPEAFDAYQTSIGMRRALASERPDEPTLLAGLVASLINLGRLQLDDRKPDAALPILQEALEAQRRLTRDHPDQPEQNSRLGLVLDDLGMISLLKGQPEKARPQILEAIDHQHKAFTARPTDSSFQRALVEHWANLKKVAEALNDPKAAAEAERERVAVRDAKPAQVVLDTKLAAVIKGDDQPRDASERLQLAQRAFERGMHSTAAWLWGEAIETEPMLLENRVVQYRYNAARAAAMAGSGRGQDVTRLDDLARTRLRNQARGWLEAETAVWGHLIDAGPREARTIVIQSLKQWKDDPNLAPVRDAPSLETLPEPERGSWRRLWAGVDALLARAQGPTQ